MAESKFVLHVVRIKKTGANIRLSVKWTTLGSFEEDHQGGKGVTCSLTVKWHVFFLMTIWWKTWNSFKTKVLISSVLSQYVVHWHLCCAGFPSLDCSGYGQEKRKGGSWLYKQGLRNWLIFKSLQPLIQDNSLHLQCTSVGIMTVGSDIIIVFFMIITICSFVQGSSWYKQEYTQCLELMMLAYI